MMIYHYTSIETLALILKNKTIRFNRLDHVDDMEESMYPSGFNKTYLGQYAFVSCWTKSAKENIPLWEKYTKFKGVRIGLDDKLFKVYKFFNMDTLIEPPFTFVENCWLQSILNEYKLFDVQYIEDLEERKFKAITKDSEEIKVAIREACLFKRNHWQFQNESRFLLIGMPIGEEAAKCCNGADNVTNLINLTCSAISSMLNNEPLDRDYIDLPLDEEKLKHIEVTMGPMTSEGYRYIVKCLLKDYPDAVIKDSIFNGKIRK